MNRQQIAAADVDKRLTDLCNRIGIDTGKIAKQAYSGEEMMKTQTQFLEEMAKHLDYWTYTLSRSVADESDDLIWAENPEAFRKLRQVLVDGDASDAFVAVIREGMQGLLHSVLMTLDGGTELSESTLLTITDSDGNEFDDHLHELFVEHLIETDRMK